VASIFTRIITGGIPGRIIWRDSTCIAMVDIRPLNRGHVLVIPIAEVDRWTDLPPDTALTAHGWPTQSAGHRWRHSRRSASAS